MKKGTRVALFASPAFILLLIGALWIYVLKPKVIDFAKSALTSVNDKQSYVKIDFSDLDISLIKLQLSVNNIQLSPTSNLTASPAQIGLVRVQLDPFSLVVGQLSISQILIHQLETEQNFNDLKKLFGQDDKPLEKIDLTPFFNLTEQWPIDKLTLSRSNLNFNLDEPQAPLIKKVLAQVGSLDFTLKRKSLKMDLKETVFALINSQNIQQQISVDADLKVDSQNFEISLLKLKHGQSHIQIQSQVKNLIQALQKPQTQSELKVELKLDEIKDFLYFIKEHKKRLPLLNGYLKFKGQFSTQSMTENQGQFELTTEEVRFENIKLGNAQAAAQLKNNQLQLNSLKVAHPSGTAQVQQIKISQKKPFEFSAQVQVEQFDLQKLFVSLGMNDIPAYVNVHGSADCQGQLQDFSIKCQAQAVGENIVVLPEMKSPLNILKVKRAETQSDISMNLNELKFKTILILPQSKAVGDGVVDFENGFKMNFQSDQFNLADIEDLAGLGLKGILQGELKTEGTTSWGQINSKIKAQNFEISGFKVGNLESELKYNKGHLILNSISGNINQSKYNGDLDINLIKSELNGQFKAQPLMSEDIISALPKDWGFQLDTVGSGSAQIQLKGPLDFWKLQYQLKAQFQRLQILGENFTQSDLELESSGDEIHFKNVVFRKPGSSIRLTDFINTKNSQDPQFDLKVSSDQLHLEDSDQLSQIFNNLVGQLSLNGTITGPIGQPQVNLKTQIRSASLDTQPLASSQGDLNINKNYLFFEGQLLGRQVQTQFKIPFKENENYVIKAQLKDFNPFIMLPLIRLPLPPADSSASITGDINLISKNNEFHQMMGTVELENIFLQRNTQTLKLVKPTRLEFNSKLRSMTPIELKGNDQTLKVSLKSANRLSLTGRLFLRPLQFLVPFADNLSGILEFNAVSNLDENKFNLSGEGLIDNGSMSFKGFKYPITEINSYFDFNQTKILVSEISANLNQTPITGSGQVDIQGPKNVIVNLNAETEKLDIEFPPQFQTTGYAKIQFFGNWLPYTLKMNYQIEQGNITKEFTEENESSVVVRPSPLLPTQKREAQNESLRLDITTDFTKGLIVKNRILEGIVTGQLKIKGTPEIPLIEGKIDIQPGSRLIFKDKPFDVQNGTVSFDGDYQINPQIQISSNARITDYDINLTVQGRAKSLDIKTTSQPFLSREDIISLLALGYISSKSDQTLSSDAQQQQTGLEVLAALSNQSKLNKKLEQKLGLNVQLAPSIDSTRNIAVPKVIVSKKLNKKVTTSYSRPLTGDRQENEVRLQYLLQKNLSLILNYQNQTNQQNSIIDNKKTDDGVGGIDLEYKKEFD